MAINCTPAALEAAAACFCQPEKVLIQIQTFELLTIANQMGAGLPTDAKSLLKLATAAGFAGLTEKGNRTVQTFLECQIAKAAGA